MLRNTFCLGAGTNAYGVQSFATGGFVKKIALGKTEVALQNKKTSWRENLSRNPLRGGSNVSELPILLDFGPKSNLRYSLGGKRQSHKNRQIAKIDKTVESLAAGFKTHTFSSEMLA